MKNTTNQTPPENFQSNFAVLAFELIDQHDPEMQPSSFFDGILVVESEVAGLKNECRKTLMSLDVFHHLDDREKVYLIQFYIFSHLVKRKHTFLVHLCGVFVLQRLTCHLGP